MSKAVVLAAALLLAIVPASVAGESLYSGVPTNPTDRSVAAFSDLGAWFGFALPSDEHPELAGAFIGPLLFDEGVWASSALLRPQVTLDGEVLNLAEAKTSYNAAPGRLLQMFDVDGIRIAFSLHYEYERRAVIHVQIYSSSRANRQLRIEWQVDADALPGTDLEVYAPAFEETVGTRETHFTVASIALDGPARPRDRKESRKARLDRWNAYLRKTSTGEPAGHPRRVLAQKALMTLVSNWRSPRGNLTHDGLFPSSAVSYFNGFWAWDSWKHAAAIARFDTELAKQQVRAMYAHQNDRGMIADVVYADPAEDNWRDTKPPLSAWAVSEILRYGKDNGFLAEMYPQIVRYHEWWYLDRDNDGDGLAEYGSTDGTLTAAKWESGMDNAVRFDTTELLQNNEEAWSMNQESVDLNAYLYKEKVLLAEFAALLGRDEDVERWTSEAETLAPKIRRKMFDEERGWFSDIIIDGSGFVRAEGPEGWIPLWAGLATPEQADSVRQRMLDPDKFRTSVPLPTVSRDNPEFSEGYWRGLVWIDQAWFGIEGLRRYGFDDDAESLAAQLLENLHGATVPGEPLRENYHPLTGEGRNAAHFSWTAAHLLMLAMDYGKSPR